MSYGIAHQNAGLNRCDAYWKTSRYKSGSRPETAHREKKNEPWRRHAGITVANEATLSRKERRKGLRRLMRWIARYVKRQELRAGELAARHPQRALQMLTLDARAEDIGGWACVKSGTLSLESLCEKLGLSAAKLSRLTREIQNIPASEFLDGLKVRRLRGLLMEQLRAAALELWGAPGYLAERRCTGLPDGSRPESGGDREDETPAEELARRTDALIAALSARDRSIGDSPLFMRLNFDSSERLSRACVNVFGRSLRQVVALIAGEVVEFYVCAEELVLRELACGDDERGTTARARWLYGQSDDAPEAPFLDRWSSAKTFRTQWLKAMVREFG